MEVCIILFYFFFQIILPSRSGVYRGLADKTVHIIQETISRQLTANKSFKRGSFLQNEDPLDFVSACSEQSICEGVLGGLFYKTKSCQLVANKAFKRGSSFCSLRRSFLQNEDPLDFASFGV